MMSLHQFFDQHLLKTNKHLPVGAISQYPLFDNFPQLKADVGIPSYAEPFIGSLMKYNSDFQFINSLEHIVG